MNVVTHVGRRLPLVILIAAVVLGAVLRLDALAGLYGTVDTPRMLRFLQTVSQGLVTSFHSPLGRWTPRAEHPHQDGPPTLYSSDPYTYLKRAREMRSFYEAHYREPVFPFTVKVWLLVLHDQDVAVSVSSAFFSVLCILLTYLMGTMTFSPWVGAIAAVELAIERDVVDWGVSGWRDDAYAAMVMLSVCAMLYYVRKPSVSRALAVGVAAGLACLTRIFAVSFLVPSALAFLAWTPDAWRQRLRDIAVASVVAAALVSPYLLNCWRQFGDPLYSLNYQPIAYLGWERTDPATNPGALGYIGGKLRGKTFETLDTAALGMTTYPFLNKWNGFEPWVPGLGRWLAGAALFGLLLCTVTANGRLLLVVLVSGLVPFAFTWRLSADWRYTEFAYPFFLVAGALTLTAPAALARPSWWTGAAARLLSTRRVGGAAIVLSAVATGIWLMLRTLPELTFREALRSTGAAVVMAGPRDGSFLKEGWSVWVTEGNVTERTTTGEYAAVEIPLSGLVDYDMTVRLDPSPPPSSSDAGEPTIRVFLNGTLLGKVLPGWNPEKVGSYDFEVPRTAVREGINHLRFGIDQGPPAADGRRRTRGIKLWYVLVRKRS